MKRLTTLAMLAAALFAPVLHSEETTVASLLPPLNLPAPVLSAMPTASAVSSISVAEMGQPRGIVLSGGQLQGGIDFTLPEDRVILNARLSLNLRVSPACS